MEYSLVDDFLYFDDRMEPKRKSVFSNVLFTVLFAVTFVLIICLSVFSFSKVVGDSMLGTIEGEDIVICTRTVKLRRGDIVTAKVDDEKSIIKRIIATGGEKIVFKTDGDAKSPYSERVHIYVDSGDGFELIEEEYLYEGIMTERSFVGQSKFVRHEYALYTGDIDEVPNKYVITLGEDEYFLLGDNRDNSVDSRNYGAFCKDDILGKVIKVAHKGSTFYIFLDKVIF